MSRIKTSIESLNHKYTTIESLLTKTHKVNTAIIRRSWFRELDIYQIIFEKSHELDNIKGVKLSERILFIADKSSYDTGICNRCGERWYFFKHSNKLRKNCKHKINVTSEDASLRMKIRIQNTKDALSELMKSDSMLCTEMELKSYLEKAKSSGFKGHIFNLSKYNLNIFHDIIVKTRHIIGFNIDSLEIGRRVYHIMNHMESVPTCKYCSRESYFMGNVKGYTTTCKYHSATENYTDQDKVVKKYVDNLINHEKYEVIHYPTRISSDRLTIRCKKCGYVMNYDISDGKSKRMKWNNLCKNCESGTSYAEEELVHHLQSYTQEQIVHGIGSRTIIPPYEIDIFSPSKNIGIEFNGVFFHSIENGKDKDYHLRKTTMCCEKGIRLVHLMETLWMSKKEIVIDNINRLFNIGMKHIDGKRLEIVELEPNEAIDFMDKNSLFHFSRESLTFGLRDGGDIVSIASFVRSKKGNNTWILQSFCDKSGHMVENALDMMVDKFMTDIRPSRLMAYLDRQWFIRNDLEKHGFVFIRYSEPELHYIQKKSNIWLEHQKTELNENMSTFHIYDCGKIVMEYRPKR